MIRSLLPLLALSAALHAAPANLLRNGSFEGGLLYWHDLSKANELVEDATVGKHSLKVVGDDYIISAPVACEMGQQYTITFDVKSEKAGTIGIAFHPSARETAVNAKRMWVGGAGKPAKVTTSWSRVSVTFPADVPLNGFWPLPNYMVQLSAGKGNTILIDGMTVTKGSEPTATYVPRSEIEVTATCANLPGFEGAAGNAFEKGATAEMIAHVSNPGKTARTITLRAQLIDYEGATPVSSPVDKEITIPANSTISEKVPVPLTHNGQVFCRLSLSHGETILDKCDFPITSIPYPKKATKPDYRERFGGSHAANNGKNLNALAKMQRLGMGWLRWQPHGNGKDHLPEKPADLTDSSTWKWNWLDDILKQQESFGQSAHLVLYPPPRWIMEGDHGSHPLPLDMRWKADDPKWQDLSIETVWDKFVIAAAKRYKDYSIIFEIENEPEFDRWLDFKLGDEYAQFTIRTAKLLRMHAPKRQIMVDNVYGIPSAINGHFLRAGGNKYIDVFSWHDYHAGWLTDEKGILKMRQNLDAAGGKHVEIWFNEGWAFTNTAVDEPPACTGLTAAQSTNQQMCSVAEMTLAGQDKTVLFHTCYEGHGMSFWDYSGPGTQLWDWYQMPLPLVPAWNTMSHHIGISSEIGFARPPGANFTIFNDLRNKKGVMVAYADRNSKVDATVELPDFGSPVIIEDIMGNAAPLKGNTLTLSKTGRPVFIYTKASTQGKIFLGKLAPLDRKNQSFVSADSVNPTFTLPASWDGTQKGSSEGSVAMADGKPIWQLEQLWPVDFKSEDNFQPMVWDGTGWNVKANGMGGQPGIALKDGKLTIASRAPQGEPARPRTAALTFVSPAKGTYSLAGTATSRIWDGKNDLKLRIVRRSNDGLTVLASLNMKNGESLSLDGQSADLSAGDKLSLTPLIDGMYAGGNLEFNDLKITSGAAGSANPTIKLPNVWEGVKPGSSEGNPITLKDKPVWRFDHLFPEDANISQNYKPMVWGNQAWTAPDHTHGGHPSASVKDGYLSMAAMGPWNGGDLNFAKIPVLAFVAPADGTYKIIGTAKSNPWDGGAEKIPLTFRKKDTQRAAELLKIELPRDGKEVPFEVEAQLSTGHELLIVPLTQGLYNNATNIGIGNLKILLE